MMLDKERRLSMERLASLIREETVELVFNGGGGHIGGDLSEVDIMVSVFDYIHNHAEKKQRDHFILSKGHSAETYYTLLHHYGYIKKEDMDEFGKFDAKLGGHPNKKINGVEANTGSLGHGLGLATGMAIALKLNKSPQRVFVLTGDGELAEGSNWEAAMSAAKYKLNNLTWIIDRNHLQISGNTEDVMPLENLKDKVFAFGFYPIEIDGHDFEQIYSALNEQKTEKPVCIIANTIKGKGLKCAENKASWHHRTPTEEQVDQVREAMEMYRKELI